MRRPDDLQRAQELAGEGGRHGRGVRGWRAGPFGVQYARRMGFEVVAIDRSDDRAELSKKLGAHHYIDSSATDIAKALQALAARRWSWPRPRAARQSPPPSAGRGAAGW